ncbi:hypothetical protein LNKW23_45170 [Paralimibaculum aggregatum]|uniref:Cadherin domain-containing protein n=1 Tax=Paralimibaculum aggregatum TaxID=3036245 RepID=A0ABQ6LT76_9RHOB|nr:tandem-95 repeat protein [Limibaculum sp. NKW23]GMG85299.1 hypothetical protein LNKW23_45170 [Limibaculum sp. NKW23]
MAKRSRAGKRSRGRRGVVLGVSGLVGLGGLVGDLPPALAGPAGGQVTQGAASIARQGATTVITQSTQRTALSWDSFDIQRGEAVQFRQPSTSAIALNTITGPKPTAIQGSLTANGQVWIQNPNGVLFGRDATVNVGGLLATTARIEESDFAAAEGRFRGGQGAVLNQGAITAGEGGVVLVAPVVENHGSIETAGGDVAIAAATGFAVDFEGDGLLQVVVDPAEAAALRLVNEGTIRAGGGAVRLTAAQAEGVRDSLVSVGGIVEATGIAEINGEIVITGGVATELAGEVTAPGGAIRVNGETVALGQTARLDVSAPAGGGRIEIGPRPSAAAEASPLPPVRIDVARGAVLAADATADGDGGRIEFWSTGATAFYGHASAAARGTGDGGFIDISSAGALGFDGTADLSAFDGVQGLLLFDPATITVGTPAADDTELDLDVPLGQAEGVIAGADRAGEALTISPAAIEAVAGDVSLDAVDSIDFNEALSIDGKMLTAEAGRITIAADITLANGGVFDLTSISEEVQISGAGSISGSGNVDIGGLGAEVFGPITLTAGDITINSNFITIIDTISTSSGNISLTSTNEIDLRGALSTSAGTIDATASAGFFIASSAGTIDASGDITLAADSNELLLDGMVTSSGGAVDISALDLIEIAGGLSADGLVTLDANDIQVVSAASAGGGFDIDGFSSVYIARYEAENEDGDNAQPGAGSLDATGGDIAIDTGSAGLVALVGDTTAGAGDITVNAESIFVESTALIEAESVALLATDRFVQVEAAGSDSNLTIVTTGTGAGDTLHIEGDDIDIHGSLTSATDIRIDGPGAAEATSVEIRGFTGVVPLAESFFLGEGEITFTMEQAAIVGPGTLNADTALTIAADTVTIDRAAVVADSADISGTSGVTITGPDGSGPGGQFFVNAVASIGSSGGAVDITGPDAVADAIDVGTLDIDAVDSTLTGEISAATALDADLTGTLTFADGIHEYGLVEVDADTVIFEGASGSVTIEVAGDAIFLADTIDGAVADDDLTFDIGGLLSFETAGDDGTTSIIFAEGEIGTVGTISITADSLELDAGIGTVTANPASVTLVNSLFIGAGTLAINDTAALGRVAPSLLAAASDTVDGGVEIDASNLDIDDPVTIVGDLVLTGGDVDIFGNLSVGGAFGADADSVSIASALFEAAAVDIVASGSVSLEMDESTILGDVEIDSLGSVSISALDLAISGDLLIEADTFSASGPESDIILSVGGNLEISESSDGSGVYVDFYQFTGEILLDVDGDVIIDAGPREVYFDVSTDAPGIGGIVSITSGDFIRVEDLDGAVGPLLIAGNPDASGDGLILDAPSISIEVPVELASGTARISSSGEINIGEFEYSGLEIVGIVGGLTVTSGDIVISATSSVALFGDTIAEDGLLDISSDGDLFFESTAEIRGTSVMIAALGEVNQAQVIDGLHFGEEQPDTIIAEDGNLTVEGFSVYVYGSLVADDTITLTATGEMGEVFIGSQPAGPVPGNPDIEQIGAGPAGTVTAGGGLTASGDTVTIESDLDIGTLIDLDGIDVVLASDSLSAGSIDVLASNEADVDADTFTVSGDVGVAGDAAVMFDAEMGGAVAIDGDLTLVSSGGTVSLTTSEAHTVGGNIDIAADGDVTVDGSSTLSTDMSFLANSDGTGGTVTISTDVTAADFISVNQTGEHNGTSTEVVIDGAALDGNLIVLRASDLVSLENGAALTAADVNMVADEPVFSIFLRAADFAVDSDTAFSGDIVFFSMTGGGSFGGVGGTLSDAEFQTVAATVPEITVFATGPLTVLDLQPTTLDVPVALTDLTIDATDTITVTGEIEGEAELTGQRYALHFGDGDPTFEIPGIEIDNGRLGANDGAELPFSELTFDVAGDVIFTSTVEDGSAILAADSMIIDIDGDFLMPNTEGTDPSPLVDGMGGAGAVLGALRIDDVQALEIYGTINGEANADAALEVEEGPGFSFSAIQQVNDCPLTSATCSFGPILLDGNIMTGEDMTSAPLDVSDLLEEAGSGAVMITNIDGTAIAVGGRVPGPEGGTFRLLADGRLVFAPGSDFQALPAGGSQTFTVPVTVTDGSGESSTATLTVRVTGANDAPEAMDVALVTDEDMASGSLSPEDVGSDIDMDEIAITSIDGMAVGAGVTVPLAGGGALVIDADGNISFDPAGGFEALAPGDSVPISVALGIEDSSGAAAEATLSITVTGVNDAPTGMGAAIETPADMVSDGVSATGLFMDPEMQALMLAAIDGMDVGPGDVIPVEGGGVIRVSGNGTLVFDPAGAFDDLAEGAQRVVTVNLTVADSASGAGTVPLTITVTGVGEGMMGPVLVDGSLETTEDMASGSLSPDTFASDPESGGLTVTAINGSVPGDGVAGIGGGTLFVDADGNLVFDPGDDFQGLMEGATDTVTFTLTLADAEGLSSTTRLTVFVGGLNDTPAGMGAMIATTENAVSEGLAPTAIGTDPDMDMLAFTAIAGMGIEGPVALEGGGVVFVDASGNLVFDPAGSFSDLAPGETRSVSVEVTVADPFAGTASGLVEITVTGEGLTAGMGEIVTDEDMASAGLDPAALVADPGTGMISVLEIDGMAVNGGVMLEGGLLFVDANGDLVFDPEAGFQDLGDGQSRSFSVDVTLSDGSGSTVTAPLTVTVTGLNDAPKPVDPGDGSPPGTINISTPEDDPTPSLMPDDLVVDPEMDMISIVAVNQQPVMNGESVAIPGGGTLTLDSAGNLVFDPGSDFDSLGTNETVAIPVSLTLADSSGAETMAELVITVIGVNDGPMVGLGTLVTDEDTATPGFSGTDIGSDPEMDPIFVLRINGEPVMAGDVIQLADGGTVRVAEDGSLIFDPAGDFQSLGPNQEGTSGIIVTIADPEGAEASGEIVFRVTGENDAPDAMDDMPTGAVADSPLTIPVLANDSDPENDGLFIFGVNGTAIDFGTFVALGETSGVELGGDGTALIFLPGTDFANLFVGESATVSFGYQVSDGVGGLSSATVSFEVAGTQPFTGSALVPGPNLLAPELADIDVMEDGVLTPDPEVQFGYFSGLGFLAPALDEEEPVTNRANDEDWPR